MSRSRPVQVLCLSGLILATVQARGAAPAIGHEKLACVPSGGNAKVVATVSSASPVTAARLYFKSAKYPTEYYMEMRRGDGSGLWAVMPIPKGETDSVQYRISTKNAAGEEATTEQFSVPAESSCRVSLTEPELGYAANLVIGLTDNQQDPVPSGFECTGVVSKITVEGVLMPHDECRRVLAAVLFAPAGAIVGAGAAAVAAGAVIISNGGGETKPISPYRPAPR